MLSPTDEAGIPAGETLIQMGGTLIPSPSEVIRFSLSLILTIPLTNELESHENKSFSLRIPQQRRSRSVLCFLFLNKQIIIK